MKLVLSAIVMVAAVPGLAQDAAARLEELVAHHEERLERTLAACTLPTTAAAVLAALFPRPLDAHQTGFALAETLAHLNYLVGQGVLRRWPGPGGAFLYRSH